MKEIKMVLILLLDVLNVLVHIIGNSLGDDSKFWFKEILHFIKVNETNTDKMSHFPRARFTSTIYDI